MRLFLLFIICSPNLVAQPVIEFERIRIDTGEIVSGIEYRFDYPFKNTGNEPLIIERTKCQLGIYPTQPILPGDSGVITAVLSRNHIGPFNKYLCVITNGKVSRKGSQKTHLIKLHFCGFAKPTKELSIEPTNNKSMIKH